MANLQVWMPEALTGSNTIYMGYKPGRKMSTFAAQLILRPLRSGGSTEDIVLYKATVQERAEVGLNSENDRVYEVTFVGLVDEDRPNGKHLGYMTVPTGS